VGDPKQAIYGFRGTDTALTDAIIERFNVFDEKTLRTDVLRDSWRSRPDIVNIVNRIFEDAFIGNADEDITGPEVSAGKYTISEVKGAAVGQSAVYLQPVRTDKGFEEVRALHHFNLVELKDDGKPDTTTEAYARAVAKSVIKLLDEKWTVSDKNRSKPDYDHDEEIVVTRPLKGSDIAVLCRTNYSAEAIAKELKERGVRVSSEVSGLGTTAEFNLFISLIELVLNRGNTLAGALIKTLTEEDMSVADMIDERLDFLSALPEMPEKPDRSGFDNEVEYENETGKYKDSLAEYYKKLNSWGEDNLMIKGLTALLKELQELPVPQFAERLISGLNLHAMVERWGNSEQRKSNLQKITELAYKYDVRCLNLNLPSTLNGFITYLRSCDQKEGITSDENAVNVLTYHRSKGLEWPVVILTDLGYDHLNNIISKEIFGIRIQNRDEIDLNDILANRFISILPWPFGAKKTLPGGLEKHIKEQDHYKQIEEKVINESKRLMYVGMTRARDYMITAALSGSNSSKYKWIDLVNEHDNWSFGMSADKETGVHNVYAREDYPLTGNTYNLFKDNLQAHHKGLDVQVHKLNLDDTVNVNADITAVYFSGKSTDITSAGDPYLISPSKVSPPALFTVERSGTVNERLTAANLNDIDEDVLGNCLHDTFYLGMCALSNGKDFKTEAAEKILANHKIDNAMIEPGKVVDSVMKLYKYLNERFRPVKWYCEMPLEAEMEEHLYRGETDLLLETENGYILLDYKSYPGGITKTLEPSSPVYAGKYAGQLETYSKMIRALTGKSVSRKFIYYTVLGELVEIKGI
jgi:ATP-dependent exoDNAse (exonuclease V) beta subunit